MGAEDWRVPEWGSFVWPKPWSMLDLEIKGLRAYATHPLFSTLAFSDQLAKNLRSFAAQLPATFRVTVMADSRITTPRLSGSRASNPHFLDAQLFDDVVWRPAIQALGPRLALVLLTFPERMLLPPDAFAARLERFLLALRTTCPVAIELRDSKMLSLAYARVLAQTDAVHAFSTAPTMPGIAEQARWVPSGPASLFRLSHPAENESWSARWGNVARLLSQGPDVPAFILVGEQTGCAVPQLIEQGLGVLATTAGLAHEAIACGKKTDALGIRR